MSTVVLQVGQAGNALGAHLWSRAVQQANASHEKRAQRLLPSAVQLSLTTPSSSSFLHSSPLFSSSSSHALCVLVDTEPKVLQSIASLSPHSVLGPPHSTSKLFHPHSLFFDQSGRGNNWALGYTGRQLGGDGQPRRRQKGGGAMRSDSGSTPSAAMASAIVERVRWTAERMDVFDSILLLHSVGGGTGAGLGSLLLETLRDTYPGHFLATTSILPFMRGESPLQPYNATLTLAHLSSHADAVLLVDNEHTLDLLSSLIRGGGADRSGRGGGAGGAGVAPLPFSVLNSHIADCLADLLPSTQPQAEEEPTGLPLLPRSFPSLLSSLCPSPRVKLLESVSTSGLLLCSAHEPLTWSSVIDVLERCTRHMRQPPGPHSAAQPHPAAVIDFAVIARGEAELKMEAWDRQRLDERMSRLLQRSHTTSAHTTHRGSVAAASISASSSSSSGRSRLGAARPSSWLGDRLCVDPCGVSMSSQPVSLSLTLNHSRPCLAIRRSLRTAQAMLRGKAYLHWYERFGCGAERMSSAFEQVQLLLDDYAAADAQQPAAAAAVAAAQPP